MHGPDRKGASPVTLVFSDLQPVQRTPKSLEEKQRDSKKLLEFLPLELDLHRGGLRVADRGTQKRIPEVNAGLPDKGTRSIEARAL